MAPLDDRSPAPDRPALGVIGLGVFGRPMARRLAAAGHAVHGFDILEGARRAAAAEGVTPAASPCEVARHARVIVLSLPTSKEVAAACLGVDGVVAGAAPGTLVIDTTSGDPVRTQAIGAELAAKGVALVDAGVSAKGGPQAAADGTLTIMVGGAQEHFDRALPVLRHLGSRVLRIGPLGAGHTSKTLNNLLLGTAMIVTAEAVAAAIKAGIDPKAMLEVIQESTGRNYCTEARFPDFVLKGDFSERSSGRLGLLDKDVAQAVAFGRSMGVPMFVGGCVHQLLQLIVAEVGPDVPSTHAIKRFEDWVGIRFGPPAQSTLPPTHTAR